MKNHPTTCIFCGSGERLTKEHVIAKWIGRKLGPGGFTRSKHTVTREDRFGRGFAPQRGRMTRQGSPIFQTIRCVCAGCNNGWMSALQTQVQDAVSKLIEQGPSGIAFTETQRIARWALVTSAVWEIADVETITLSRADRKLLMEGNLSSRWSVGIAGFSGRQSGSVWHRALALNHPITGLPVKSLDSRAQLTLIPLGNILFATTSAGENFFDQAPNFSRSIMESGFLGIWPQPGIGTPKRFRYENFQALFDIFCP